MTKRTVGEVMTTDVVSVREDATFREIVDLLETRGISAVPVVDWANMVVGVVSEADLLPKMEYAGREVRRRLFEGHRVREAREKAAGDLARDLMTRPAMTVLPETTVVHAARLMDSAGVKRLPVVSLAGRLIGIVSRRDLLKVFLRTDVAITDDVRRELEPVPGVDATVPTIQTTEGIVTLAGELDRRSLIPVVVRLAERVEGVVDVVDRLSFRTDDTKVVVPYLP
jgi:CBS-domain-containing membrane protein